MSSSSGSASTCVRARHPRGDEPKRRQRARVDRPHAGHGQRPHGSQHQRRVPRPTEIAYNGVSADLAASGIRGHQQYRTVSGDLVLDRLAGDVRVRAVSGDISLRADDRIGLEMNTVSGDVSAFAPRFEKLGLATVSGDVEVEGELAGGPRHRVETVSGDLSLGVVGGLALEVRGLSSDAEVRSPTARRGPAIAAATPSATARPNSFSAPCRATSRCARPRAGPLLIGLPLRHPPRRHARPGRRAGGRRGRAARDPPGARAR